MEENICRCKSDGIFSREYEELSKLNNKNKTIKCWTEDLRDHFSKEDVWMEAHIWKDV